MGGLKTPILISLLVAATAFAEDFVEKNKLRRYGEAPVRLEKRHFRGQNKAVIGIVEKMTGPGHVGRGGNGRTSISIGLRVFEFDKLITEDQSRMHVRYKDGTYVELGASSQFQVERIRFKAQNLLPANKPEDQFDESVFRFVQGIVRVTAPDIHALEHFVVKTPGAVVKVTGPSDFYLVQLPGDRELTVRVAKGKVELMNTITNELMPVPQGTGAYQKVSGVVSGAGPFTEEQVSFLKSRTRI